jgi:excisionase family DNA binding protein
MPTTTAPPVPPPPTAPLLDDVPYTPAEIAAYHRVSLWTIQRRMAEGLLPFSADGRTKRITGAQYKQFLANTAHGANEGVQRP